MAARMITSSRSNNCYLTRTTNYQLPTSSDCYSTALQNGGEYAENRILSRIIYGPRPRRHTVYTSRRVCALHNRYFKSVLFEIWLHQFCIVFRWDTACVHSSPDPSLFSGSGLACETINLQVYCSDSGRSNLR